MEGKSPLASADAYIAALAGLGRAMSAARRAVLRGDIELLDEALRDATRAKASCDTAEITIPATTEEELRALLAYVSYQRKLPTL